MSRLDIFKKTVHNIEKKWGNMNIYKLPVVEIGECVHKNKHNCVDVDFFTLFLTTIFLKDTKNTTGSNEQGCFFYIKKIIAEHFHYWR